MTRGSPKLQAAVSEGIDACGEFIARYNAEWLIERLGHRRRAQARAEAMARRVRYSAKETP